MTDKFLAKNNLDRANTCELELIKKGQANTGTPIQEKWCLSPL